MIRKISAHYIFPVSGPALKYGIIICSKDGEIQNVIDTGGIIREMASLEFYDGILVPGFIKKENETEASLLEHLRIILNLNKNLRLEEGIRSITLDRAVDNQAGHIYGSFEAKKFPGINLISGIDFSLMRLRQDSRLRVLVPQGLPR